MPTAQLTERIADWNRQLQVQSEERLVKNVALTGNMSRNGYAYDDQAHFRSRSLYNGKPVFLDHAHNGQRPQLRSTRDLVGSIINPRIEEGRVRGDIRGGRYRLWTHFPLALVEANTPGVGMSHVVLAERTNDGKRVKPHQRRPLRRRRRESRHDQHVSGVDIDSRTGRYTTRFDVPHRTARCQSSRRATRRTANRTRSASNGSRCPPRLAAKKRHRTARAGVGTPAEAVDASFRTQLEQAASTSAAKQLVRERQQLVRRLGSLATPHSAPRTNTVPNDAANFISAIKHRS
ncbi:MAG: hypothetical protein H6824_07965 [Planctomycetaceae bacterium]|nr:hypothetical protein [Planctomycetaceae bacterium]